MEHDLIAIQKILTEYWEAKGVSKTVPIGICSFIASKLEGYGGDLKKEVIKVYESGSF